MLTIGEGKLGEKFSHEARVAATLLQPHPGLAPLVHPLCLEQELEESGEPELRERAKVRLDEEGVEAVGHVRLEEEQEQLVGGLGVGRVRQSREHVEGVELEGGGGGGEEGEEGVELADGDLLLRVVLDEAEEGGAQVARVLFAQLVVTAPCRNAIKCYGMG